MLSWKQQRGRYQKPTDKRLAETDICKNHRQQVDGFASHKRTTFVMKLESEINDLSVCFEMLHEF